MVFPVGNHVRIMKCGVRHILIVGIFPGFDHLYNAHDPAWILKTVVFSPGERIVIGHTCVNMTHIWESCLGATTFFTKRSDRPK